MVLVLPKHDFNQPQDNNICLNINPEGGFVLKERAPGVSIEQIKAATAGRLLIPDVVPEF